MSKRAGTNAARRQQAVISNRRASSQPGGFRPKITNRGKPVQPQAPRQRQR